MTDPTPAEHPQTVEGRPRPLPCEDEIRAAYRRGWDDHKAHAAYEATHGEAQSDG